MFGQEQKRRGDKCVRKKSHYRAIGDTLNSKITHASLEGRTVSP